MLQWIKFGNYTNFSETPHKKVSVFNAKVTEEDISFVPLFESCVKINLKVNI